MKDLKVVIGADHAGFDYKNALVSYLQSKGIALQDVGTFSDQSVDYPDFAHLVASAVEQGQADYGILLCGSGNGVAITANKHQQIRAALCWSVQIAALARQHNDANIICLPARFVTQQQAIEMVEIFLQTPFEGGRHLNRIRKIACSY
ncbi:MAG: ribose 5-phosphate isomerase B [Cytophagales bacterium]|nr:ribose 5-phosphate isomerase B [Bernardetiaceae bacterium]MDW8210605.1 ribose 5-phosphate isomerase B [Cytophagales bacterium]